MSLSVLDSFLEQGIFGSLYESFNPLTTVNKQHFIEWFSGDDLDTIWTKFNSGPPTGTFAMKDEVDGGYSVLMANSTVTIRNAICQGNLSHYSATGSVSIIIAKKVTDVVNFATEYGFSNDLLLQSHFSIAYSDTGDANFSIYTYDGTTSSRTQGSVPRDIVWRCFKIENTSSNNKMTINGTLDVTKTTNRPVNDMQIYCAGLAYTTGASDKEIRVRYVEAYNT